MIGQKEITKYDKESASSAACADDSQYDKFMLARFGAAALAEHTGAAFSSCVFSLGRLFFRPWSFLHRERARWTTHSAGFLRQLSHHQIIDR